MLKSILGSVDSFLSNQGSGIKYTVALLGLGGTIGFAIAGNLPLAGTCGLIALHAVTSGSQDAKK